MLPAFLCPLFLMYLGSFGDLLDLVKDNQKFNFVNRSIKKTENTAGWAQFKYCVQILFLYLSYEVFPTFSKFVEQRRYK